MCHRPRACLQGSIAVRAVPCRELLWPPSIHGHAQVTDMIIRRNVLAALVSVFSAGNLYADPVATPVDLSANVIESVLPGGTIFHDSKPVRRHN